MAQNTSPRISRTSSWKDITPGAVDRQRPIDADRERRQNNPELMWRLMNTYLSNDVHSLQRSVVHHVEHTLACTRFDFDELKAYLASAYSVRDRLIESWNDTNAHFTETDSKRVSYLSLEFLIGRSFQNALMNMELEDNYASALREFGFQMETLYEQERDAALGNGGLGRLAACFLDSMATLNLPAWGYGIRYTYGIFRQEIHDGYQVENPDYWLTHGNPFEIERKDVNYPVRFYGHVAQDPETGCAVWHAGETVQAIAYDTPIPGYDTFNTINLRLWRSAPAKEFDLQSFNDGDYMQAVADRQRAETITHVLYPSDNTYSGKELRLKQQYFFVAATLQDIVRRFKKIPTHQWTDFASKNAIQLNDTHPSIAVPELFRMLIDEEGLSMDEAWPIVEATFSYTNHTIMPEALEKWPVDLLGNLLPRHLQLIYDINWRFLQTVEARWPGDMGKLEKLSIISENPKSVRMAHLSIVCSHKVNGVAELHTQLLVGTVFPEFCELYPTKFVNMTNGVTPRRWIAMANPGLAATFTKWLGSDAWLTDLAALEGLREHADNSDLQAEWAAVKLANKRRLADMVEREVGVVLQPETQLFDVQVKRIHEYKRQQMNVLYCIHHYLQIKAMTPEQRANVVPRATIIGGKAAPGYAMAKKFIKLIHDVGNVINNDPDVGDLFKLVFIADYCVSRAEVIIPASDISEHISTAGMEASGTSNMKFAMNGGLIIGTLDGANVEMAQEAGIENLFIFGTRVEDVETVRLQRRFHGPGPLGPNLAAVIDQLQGGAFCEPAEIAAVLHTLRPENDYYLVTADFDSYVEAQDRVDATFVDKPVWNRMSILTAAGMGKFSTDRTMREYAADIWGITPCKRTDPLAASQERRSSVTGAGAGAEEPPEF